jgi:hypothetical protein
VGRVNYSLVRANPDDPRQMAEAITELQELISGNLSLGHPQDPDSDTSNIRAGEAAGNHPGTQGHIEGSWVELQVDDSPTTNSSITCYHNLNVPVAVSGEPNVRWQIWGWSHDGTGSGADTAVDVGFIAGDAVTVNSIDLFVYANTLTVDADHPLKVTLRFIPAIKFTET